MEKYEKPNMEVLDFQNDVILTSCTLNTCGGGTLGYSGPCGDCSDDAPCDNPR
ncbi:MAG: hypothetical protein II969_03530 [Anaerolineaceae bacterium]|nr:hypothetical protein [Anaerolineaceae bacterium]